MSTHNNINQSKYQAVGDIDEKGAIHDLTRCGYNDYNSYSGADSRYDDAIIGGCCCNRSRPRRLNM